MLYPLGPTAVVLSWTRPYLGVFRKYVVEMFYFNPATMTSEWTTYYEIAATVSLTASVVSFKKLDLRVFCKLIGLYTPKGARKVTYK